MRTEGPGSVRPDQESRVPTGCRVADELLFKAGDADAVDEACRRSQMGKRLPNALYVHRTASMRWTRCCGSSRECARTYLGEIEGANLIKLHRQSGKVSYLVYPDFETNPHPALLRSVKLALRTPRDRLPGVRQQPQPAGPPPQGVLPAGRAPASRPVRPAERRRRSTACSPTRHPSGLATGGTRG